MQFAGEIDNRTLAQMGVDLASRILELDEIKLLFLDDSHFSNKDVNAMFIKHQYYIVLRQSWIDSAPQTEVLSSVFHEARHAYQNAQIEFPEFFSYNEPIQRIKQWNNEFSNYTRTSEGEEFYKNSDYCFQDIEIDAVAFEQLLLNELFGDISTPHEAIKDFVLARKKELKIRYEPLFRRIWKDVRK